MRSLPSEKQIEMYYGNEQACIQYLLEKGVLYTRDVCPYCETGGMKRYLSRFKQWTCNNKKCNRKISVFKDSFFAKNHIRCHDLLRIAYKCLSGQNYSSILNQTEHSSGTICDHMRLYRELVAEFVEEEHTIIGGPGIEVEVDESKFGRVKYHRGHAVDGVWVLGGVERTEQRRVFLAFVPNRAASTLVEVLRQHVKPGSTVYTDLWKGYNNIEDELSVHHLTVNHSKAFKDPNTGAHTNNIEGTWSGIKGKIAPRNRTATYIDDHLMEFIWRRQNAKDLWGGFLKCLKTSKY